MGASKHGEAYKIESSFLNKSSFLKDKVSSAAKNIKEEDFLYATAAFTFHLSM